MGCAWSAMRSRRPGGRRRTTSGARARPNDSGLGSDPLLKLYRGQHADWQIRKDTLRTRISDLLARVRRSNGLSKKTWFCHSAGVFIATALPLHIALANGSTTKDPMAEAEIVAGRAREQISRVEHLDQNNLILNPVAIMCSSLEDLHHWLYGVIAHHIVDVDGCYKFFKPAKITVLDYPNILSAHVKLDVNEDNPDAGGNKEFYTIPSQIIERE